MMKWLNLLAASCAVALFGSCEQHEPDVLDRLPGHHASHGDGHHGEDHAEGHGEHGGVAPATHHPEATAAPQPTAAAAPPKYFND